MEFYFQKDGQNVGPLALFQVRELLDDGVLLPTQLGWHEGMAGWLPVEEIQALQGVLPRAGAAAAVDPAPLAVLGEMVELRVARELSRVRHRQAWRRLFARMLDLWMGWLVMMPLAAWWGWIHPGELMLPSLPVFLVPPLLWLPVEVGCLRRWGCTPGKAMLGLRVLTAAGERLSWRQAWTRAFDVWFVGCGMELMILAPLLKLVALARYRQTGETAWDAALQLRVEFRPLPTLGVMAGVLLGVAVLVVRMLVFFHADLPDYLRPEDRSFWEQLHAGRPT